MITRLAKLADLKSLIGTTETTQDTLLLQLLDRASATAEELAGHGLIRRYAQTEYPYEADRYQRRVRLNRWPIESVTSVKQLYAPGSVAEFTAETSLTEDVDFHVEASRGLIERWNANWYLAPHCLQVVYTGGFGDPANLDVTTVSGNADAIGVRAGETEIGGVNVIYAGAATAVDGLADNDTTYIWLANSGGGVGAVSSAVDGTGWPGTAHAKLAEVTMRGGAIAQILDRRSHVWPPLDLQNGVLQEALQLWNYRATGGVADIDLVGGGGYRARGIKPHEALVTAVEQWKCLM